MQQRELSALEKDIAEIAKLLNAEYIERLKERLAETAEKLLENLRCVSEEVKQIFGMEIDKIIAVTIERKCNRVLWLALYHPKERVRKKNIRRIKRIAKRMGKIKKENDNATY